MAENNLGSENTVDGGDVAEQLRVLRADVAALAETIRTLGAQRVEAGADALRNAAERTGETLRMSADDARRRGEMLAEDLESRIAANPIPSVLIATGVGLLLGTLFSRR
ncbi:DUF883 family protein [Prosthecomicrobium pneumaticum]|uniref:ElaB/YqjD/DUF883 family membrane-anchored ribosome-binding protein n=1 Tax=Prosthecomicrobium pneumaticum TaxID=81895 RepID=A0A7W9FMC2_9HYPH|nr:DUF883 family protein [Prosthecomicrobium pneumaticum]MBB5753298.1 ElaB/YqjD/DUF883 family membrane-anchored ribosome-binding protein [Prosthecomicrobium pneumaticum]